MSSFKTLRSAGLKIGAVLLGAYGAVLLIEGAVILSEGSWPTLLPADFDIVRIFLSGIGATARNPSGGFLAALTGIFYICASGLAFRGPRT